MAKIALSQEERKTLHKALARVWDEISPDVGEVESNEHAVELCIDADRLANVDPIAYSVWDKIRTAFNKGRRSGEGYTEALSYVANYVVNLV